MKIKLYIFIILFCLIPLRALAFTYVTENITSDKTWDLFGSPYIIENDVQVYPNVKLNVLPGVEVRFGTNASPGHRPRRGPGHR